MYCCFVVGVIPITLLSRWTIENNRNKSYTPPLILLVFVLRFSGGSKQHLAGLYTLFELFFFLPCAGGLVAYFAFLLVSNEITRQDVAVVVPWIRVKPYEVSGG
jgi:hypothetical protein